MDVSDGEIRGGYTPLNFTMSISTNPVPVILSRSPGRPLKGENELIFGTGVITVKGLVLTAVPVGVVTRSVPVVAPAGTIATMDVAETLTSMASVALNNTERSAGPSTPK